MYLPRVEEGVKGWVKPKSNVENKNLSLFSFSLIVR